MKGEGLRIVPLAFGFFCAWTQLTLLRDFVSLTGGRALWIGWFFGAWLIASGIPMLIGGRIRDEKLNPWAAPLVGLSVTALPFISIFIQWLPGKLTGHIGLLVPLLPSLGWGAVASGLMSFILGFLFLAIRSRMKIRREGSRTVALYAVETVGFAVGALLFVATGGWGGHILKALAAGALLPAAFLVDLMLARSGRDLRGDIFMASLAFVSLIILAFTSSQLERTIVFGRYADLGVAHQTETPYGRLVRVDAEWNHSFYRDGRLLFTTDDYDYAEELAHLVLLQHPNARDILILGLGSDRLPFEVLKYPGSKVTLVERDHKLLKEWIELRKDEIDEERVTFVSDDAREFLEWHPGEFDTVIFSHVDASDLASNRLLTKEGLNAARTALRKDGVLGLGLEAEENYSDPVAVMASASVFKSLGEIFDNVLVTPLYAHIFIAGDGDELTLDPLILGERMEGQGISGMFLNKYTLLDRLPLGRTDGLHEALSNAAPGSNSDLNPLTFRLAFQLEMLRESPMLARIYRIMGDVGSVIQVVLLIVGAVAGLLFSLSRRTSSRVFIVVSSAFLLMGSELLLVLLWQNIGGGLVTHIAVITTAAMLGAAVGAWFGNRERVQASGLFVGLCERILVLEVVSLIIAMLVLSLSSEWLGSTVILVFALIIPATIGFQFALLCRVSTLEGRPDAPLYGYVPTRICV